MPLPLTRWDRLALIVILAVGAWLRIQHTGDIEVNIDQVYPVYQAIRTLDAGEFPLTGQGTSVLFANPPLTGYFFVPALALARQPIMAYAVTLLLNSFAVWLAYRGLRWLIGTRPALVGAALVAVNPWIIEDSRRTWVQALAPFFVTLVFWALAPLITGQTRHPARRALIALVGLALFAHTYLLAYALVAPLAVLLAGCWWWRRERVPIRAVIAGGLVFAALMALFGIGLLRQWDDTRQRAAAFTEGESRLSDEALRHAVRLVTGWEYAAARGQSAPADDAELRGDLSDVVHVVWTLALAAGILRAGWAVIRHRRGGTGPVQGTPMLFKKITGQAPPDAALVLLVWLALPVLMMSYVSRVVHPFYLLLTVPAGHGLAAWGVASLLRWRGTQALLVAAVIATGAINGLNAVRFAQETAATPGEHVPEPLPLAETTKLGAALRAAGAPERAVFTPMGSWTTVAMVGHDLRAEMVSHPYDRAVLVPPEGAVYVQFGHVADSAYRPPLGGTEADRLLLDDGTLITLWTVAPGDVPLAHPAAIPSDSGVTFAGWTLAGDLAPGGTAELLTFWRIESLAPDRGVWNFAPFAHVYDADGARVQVADGVVIPALKWAAGDLMVQRLMLAPPPGDSGPLTVRVGLFDAVRTRPDGAPGVNAVFHVPDGDGGTAYTVDIALAIGD